MLLDLDVLVCLRCYTKYQIMCECYLKVLYATVLFLQVANQSLSMW